MNVTELFRSARILSPDNQQSMQQNTNVTIQYPSVSPYIAAAENSVQEREVELEDINAIGIEEKEDQISLLQLLLNVYMKNPLIVNKYVICAKGDLELIVKQISKCDKCIVNIDEDSIVNCSCGSNKYAKIASILVYKNEIAYDFKYQYNQQYNFLKYQHISLHFVC